jgi:chemotaxis protein CheY-P-specific phosphatase CheC
MAAKMIFYGHSSGELHLRVSSVVIDQLVENMLGESVEGEEADAKRKDALKEILNMICGNFLTTWAGEDPVYELSPPEIIKLQTDSPDEENAASVAEGSDAQESSPEESAATLEEFPEPEMPESICEDAGATLIRFNLENTCAEIIVKTIVEN